MLSYTINTDADVYELRHAIVALSALLLLKLDKGRTSLYVNNGMVIDIDATNIHEEVSHEKLN